MRQCRDGVDCNVYASAAAVLGRRWPAAAAAAADDDGRPVYYGLARCSPAPRLQAMIDPSKTNVVVMIVLSVELVAVQNKSYSPYAVQRDQISD